MPPPRVRVAGTQVWYPWFVVVALALMALFVVSGGSFGGRASTSEQLGLVTPRAPLGTASPVDSTGCDAEALSTVSVTPSVTTLEALSHLDFRALALNGCGQNVTSRTNFSWALTTPDMGSLSNRTGPTTSLTACLSPMQGWLTLHGAYGLSDRSANASVTVLTLMTVGNGTTLAPLPTENATRVPTVWAWGATLILGAGALVLVARVRSPSSHVRRPRETAVEEASDGSPPRR